MKSKSFPRLVNRRLAYLCTRPALQDVLLNLDIGQGRIEVCQSFDVVRDFVGDLSWASRPGNCRSV
jgi:hypothetical protein